VVRAECGGGRAHPSSSRQTASWPVQSSHLTYMVVQQLTLYETIKHATTTDQYYATCYGLRSPLAELR